jgi:hypothetical protein
LKITDTKRAESFPGRRKTKHELEGILDEKKSKRYPG